jgi:hypothetical protein
MKNSGNVSKIVQQPGDTEQQHEKESICITYIFMYQYIYTYTHSRPVTPSSNVKRNLLGDFFFLELMMIDDEYARKLLELPRDKVLSCMYIL